MYLDMALRCTIHVVSAEDTTTSKNAISIECGYKFRTIQRHRCITFHLGSNIGSSSGSTIGIVLDGSTCHINNSVTTHISQITATVKIVTNGTALHLHLSVMLHNTGLTTTEDIALDIGIITDSDSCIDTVCE